MGLLARLKRTFNGKHHQAEIDEELAFHLALDAQNGATDREARMRLGNPTLIAEETRSAGILNWLDSVLQDAAYGVRQLRKSPSFVFAVVISLALGIGANSAIFSLVDAALLRPLPVRDPGALRIIEWDAKAFPKFLHNVNGDFHPLGGGAVHVSSIGANVYRTLAQRQTGFESLMAVADPSSMALTTPGVPAEQISLQYVSSNLFQGLGVAPAAGRAFRDDEDRPGAEPVIVISHRFWMQRFGGRDGVLGQLVRINQHPARIIGVAPVGFFGTRAGQWNDAYAPLAARAVLLPSAHGEDDLDWWVRPIGRLKPGVSEAVALSQLSNLFRMFAIPVGVKVEPSAIPRLVSLPGRRGLNALNTPDTAALWILLSLVAVLLLIVCANVANLLLSRSVSRRRESAVRLALGAARLRIFRQHLIESGVLAVMGGAAGLLLGYVLAHGIHILFQFGRDSVNTFDLHLDPRVVGYTAALSLLTALVFGLAPAWQAARADLSETLKAQNRTVAGGQLRLPKILVSLQIALCLSALVAAGLLGHSLNKLKWQDVGFDRENMVYATVNPWQANYSPEQVTAYVSRLRAAVAQLPGVLNVSVTEVRPLSGNGNMMEMNFPGRPKRESTGPFDSDVLVQTNRVSDGFFETMHIPLVAGRTFTPSDLRATSDAAIVDELFVDRFFPKQNPIGRRFGTERENDNRYEIVGVVRNSLYNSLRDARYPTLYQPHVAGELHGAVHLVIRSAMDSSQLGAAVHAAAGSVDAAVPVTEFHTQTELIDRLLRTERLLGFLSAAFGVIALLLAAIGLGGLLAYGIARRTNEIGIRISLGASAGDMTRMVLRDTLKMVAFGVLAGAPCAYLAGRVLKSMLFGVQPLDPWAMGLSLAVLVAAVLLASWIPARRAASVDPMTALREE